MECTTIIHSRVMKRHPNLRECEVAFAWEGYLCSAIRIPGEREVRLGFDQQGRLIEMVDVHAIDGWLVFHAMTPPSNKTIDEMRRAMRRL